jgi:hypothetical protein
MRSRRAPVAMQSRFGTSGNEAPLGMPCGVQSVSIGRTLVCARPEMEKMMAGR